MTERVEPVSEPDREQDPDLAPPADDKALARALRLRPSLPPVVRLSRKALIALGGALGVGIGGALLFALQTRDGDDTPSELYSTDRVAQADGLATLPRDYSGVPRLGPPLPGDLGRPMLSAQERGQPVPIPPPGGAVPPPAPPVDPAIERAAQEREAARTSALFNDAGRGGGADAAAAGAALPPPVVAPPVTEPTAAPALSRGEAFLAREPDRHTASAERIRAPLSPYVLQAGAVIPAALVTGLRADLPGQVVAQVTQGVFDSPTGRHLLIPQGSRLIGQYDAEVGFGQERVLLVWERLIFPDGRSILLDRQPGADAQGYAGLQDRVDNHWGRLFRAGILSTLLGIGAELGSDSDSDIARAIRDGAQRSIGDAGQEVVRRQLEVRPTLTIRPGFPLRVVVTRDLYLEPEGDDR